MGKMGQVYRSNIFFCVMLVISILGSIICGRIFPVIGITDVRIILFLNHTLFFLIPAIIYVILTKQSFKQVFKLNRMSVKNIFLVILLGFVCVPLMNSFGIISSIFFENTIQSFMGNILETPYIILLLLIAVMPAITEEITLRGVVLSGYDEKSKLKAALMSGVLFGIFHLNAHQFLYTMALGFILAYAVRVTGSIYASMIMHFILNGTSITLQKIMMMVNTNQESIELIEKIDFMYLGSAIVMIILMGTIAFFILKKLEKNYNIKNGIVVNNQRTFKYIKNKEKIINIPFIMSIIIYIVFMYLFR
ncbi:type II CAAX endopeptidase family protein [uncultured Clostridium sp.]|uniref:CPBP family intramembrane glutamic endopeptidase n=1 Tax=uncultured Clostridium sp. TaxID=59620 RepID=UPI002622D500|nr:type II CAAX endopeptidase family protein [uncultured Clostridium sp.]